MKRLQLEEDEANSTNDYNGVDLNIARLNGREEMLQWILKGIKEYAEKDESTVHLAQIIVALESIDCKGDLE